MDDRLAGLALATATKQAVTLVFVEGDPRPGCPLSGRRALVALETCANYAQGLDVDELRIQPLNPALAELYETIYGFRLASGPKPASYYAKSI